ncbi:hypothetical protein C5F61_01195 [Photobacterium damselae subsp. damselae]|nr:hypothetical protein C5F61_01195 [Photobacterium damselae subsp. damselae]PSB82994.1 hypothetical protein C5F62_08590 [Photobacterium damselae subsp. damselae]TGZ34015.1 hypothetical protein EQ875_02581 [Photobacterium damselae subsp. damselae]SPY31587.1 Uncharacterised protein [Photobacterium damselae]
MRELFNAVALYFASIFESKQKLNEIKIKELSKQDDLSFLNRGLKDDLLVIAFYFPVLMLFIPQFHNQAVEGFKSLQVIPQYYYYGLVLILVDTFGFRVMLRKYVERKFK